MSTRAAIFGVSGPRLSAEEATFFSDAAPWGFILFSRNVETPEQVRSLVSGLRDTVGRNAPVLIDQEGGRVQRLRPPHWRGWSPVGALMNVLGGDEAALREALALRYRLIAAELTALGIDVNCVPLLDLPVEGGDAIIGDRALGRKPDEVAGRAQAVIAGLKAGGVLPVIKHLPGHGRALVDSHLALPRVAAPLSELDRTDFAAFRPVAEEAMGMTAHVVFEAIDSLRPATESSAVIELIRQRIGFDGLLMTDDLSMDALSGPVRDRADRALAAGCDLVLHCNGDLAEMREIAAAIPALAGERARRAEMAEAARPVARPFDEEGAFARYRTLAGETVDA